MAFVITYRFQCYDTTLTGKDLQLEFRAIYFQNKRVALKAEKPF